MFGQWQISTEHPGRAGNIPEPTVGDPLPHTPRLSPPGRRDTVESPIPYPLSVTMSNAIPSPAQTSAQPIQIPKPRAAEPAVTQRWSVAEIEALFDLPFPEH